MRVVYRTDHLLDAYLVKHRLEDAGIYAFILGESLLGAAGELPLFGMVRVGVPDSCAWRAQELLMKWQDECEKSPMITEWDETPGWEPG